MSFKYPYLKIKSEEELLNCIRELYKMGIPRAHCDTFEDALREIRITGRNKAKYLVVTPLHFRTPTIYLPNSWEQLEHNYNLKKLTPVNSASHLFSFLSKNRCHW
jgi:hypothetical protein